MSLWSHLGKIVSAPVRVPVRLVKKGTEKAMGSIIAGLVRHAITTYGGALVSQGLISSSDLETGIGALVTLGGIVWSIVHKISLKKA